MAISSNPNSRPISSPRNSETNSPMRSSFSENPFQKPSIHTNPRNHFTETPANSPTEFSRTIFLVKEEKENEKDHRTLKPSKARSPTVPKISNNFMKPTFSAALKTNPSPRTKILTDKNEPLRTSLSFSDLKRPSDLINNFREKIDTKPDKGFDSKNVEISEDVFETPSNTIHLPKCPSHNSSKSSDIKPIMGSSNKLLASSISPLDADPCLPPYDPKMNYLSPRPQFRHYKPNPRLEHYYQKEQGSGTKNLEDSFLSESSTDTEVSEESESENSQKDSENDSSIKAINEVSENDSEEASLVEGINEKFEKEPKKDYSVQAIIEKFEKESKVKPTVFEPEPITTSLSTLSSKNSSEEKKVTKSSFFTRAKVISLLLILLIGSLSLCYTHYPILSSSKFYEENFNGFARNLKLWSDYSTSYVNELIGNLRGEDKLGLSQFRNLTSMLEDPFIRVKWFEEINEQDEVDSVDEDDDKFDSLLDLDPENDINFEGEITDLQNAIDFEEKLSLEEAASEVLDGNNHITSDSKIKSFTEVYSFGNHMASDSEIESNTAVHSSGDDHLISHSIIESSTANSDFEITTVIDNSLSQVQILGKGEGDNIVPDSEIESATYAPSSGPFQVDPEYNSKTSENVEIKGDDHIISDSKIELDSGNTLEMDTSNSLKQYETVAISLLAMALVAAPVLIYLKSQKPSSSFSIVHTNPISINKTIKLNHNQQNDSPEVDLNGESCPSEMSSFDWGMWGTTNEAHSLRRRQKRALKRESLASSSEFSMGDSPSYGSFTTYERFPIKHGYGDDGVVTPVRRSSRIKKIQITSS